MIDKGEALITLRRELSGVNHRPHGRIRDQERANAVGIVNLAKRRDALATPNLNLRMLWRRTDIQQQPIRAQRIPNSLQGVHDALRGNSAE
jgi:hypothetical protein